MCGANYRRTLSRHFLPYGRCASNLVAYTSKVSASICTNHIASYYCRPLNSPFPHDFVFPIRQLLSLELACNTQDAWLLFWVSGSISRHSSLGKRIWTEVFTASGLSPTCSQFLVSLVQIGWTYLCSRRNGISLWNVYQSCALLRHECCVPSNHVLRSPKSFRK
jgi:hypothetical protein